MDDEIRNKILKDFTEDKLKNASQEYINKMNYLATCKDVLTNGFIMHDYVRDEYDENHMMYKCGAPLSIESDGITVTYEFLIEYDIRKPNEGIYYGCKALLDENIKTEKDYKTSLEFIEEQFEEVRDRLVAVLSNTFPGKDFSKRLLLTDNAYSSTYWPFWIRLNSEEEDIVKVAARATRLIRNVYKKDLGLTELEQYSKRSDWRDTKCAKEYDPEQMKIETETAFTEEAWNKFWSKSKLNDEQKKFLKQLFVYEDGDIIDDSISNHGYYEKCLRIYLNKFDSLKAYYLLISKGLGTTKQELFRMKILESVIFFPKEGKNNALYHSKSLDKYDEETKEAISKELDEIKKTELDNLENKLSFFDTLTNRKFS